MPKQKTHSGTKKRFRMTKTGKIMREQANRRHNFESKPTSRTRRLGMNAVTSDNDKPRIKRLLGK